MTQVGVVGAGAIGGWVSAALARAGHMVSVLARGRTLAAIGRDGIGLVEGETASRFRVTASGDAASLGRQDVLVFAVKAPAFAAAVEAGAAMIGCGTVIVPMLNGVPWWFLGDGASLETIDSDGRIAAALPAGQVLGCVVHASAHATAPGVVSVGFVDKLIFGEPVGGASDRLAGVAALFAGAGIASVASADVRRDIWYKLWGNMTINPISALTLATADRILENPELAAFVMTVMAEARAIGVAIGCPIDEDGAARMRVTRRLGAFRTSMLADVEAGRAIELEALLGAPREIGRRVGVPTPAMDALYGLTRVMAESRGLLPR